MYSSDGSVLAGVLALGHDQAEQLQQLGVQAKVLASYCKPLCEEDICEIVRQLESARKTN